MPRSVRVVGLGGSLRTGSTSRTALLQTAPDGAQAASAEPSLIWVRDLDLPMHTP
jgi:NAD(P)H-dependent FMN reductase